MPAFADRKFVNDILRAVLQALNERNMTISELARRSGTSRPSLSRWLSGKQGLDIADAVAVLAALNLEITITRKSHAAPSRHPSGR